jgi:hypothetical protein
VVTRYPLVPLAAEPFAEDIKLYAASERISHYSVLRGR